MKKYLYLFLLLNICSCLWAQSNSSADKQRHAVSLFYQGDMQSAIPMFQDLYKQQQSDYYYQYLLQAKVMVQDYNFACKLIKEHNKNHLSYHEPFDRAYVAYAKGQMRQADKYFQRGMDNMPLQKAAYVAVANQMRRRALLDWAEILYKAAQKRMPEEYFHLDLASLYQVQQKYKPMTEVLLQLLLLDERQLKSVQYRFQNVWRKQGSDSLQQYAKTNSLWMLQKQPNHLSLRAFLLWLSIQQKDFKMAEMQAAALDRQTYSQSDKPPHLFVLSRILLQHAQYHQAKAILNTMLSAEAIEQTPLFPALWRLYLQAAFADIKHAKLAKEKELADLQCKFIYFSKHLGCPYYSVELATSYADFLAHYIRQADSAIVFLEEGMSCFKMQKTDKAAVKLYLADLYQEIGQPWEANLCYAQIERELPHEPIAAQARYKNALLSLFLGEIGWAEAQVEVLKAATDKAIANDAIQLSLYIKECNKYDSTGYILRSYGKIRQQMSFGSDSIAVLMTDSLLQNISEPDILAFLSLQKANLFLLQAKNKEAEAVLEELVSDYRDTFVADEALWRLAQLQKKQADKYEKAMESYKLLITKYPNSFFTPMAIQLYQQKNTP